GQLLRAARRSLRATTGDGERRLMKALLPILVLASIAGCDREEREFHTLAPASSLEKGLRLSPIQPGASEPPLHAKNKYEGNAYAMSEGQTLYNSFNCVGCHSHGGGGMGPPLMDEKWLYGHEPEQIYATIMQGRPNGMPSFRGKVTDDQAWKLVAYVRSISGL